MFNQKEKEFADWIRSKLGLAPSETKGLAGEAGINDIGKHLGDGGAPTLTPAPGATPMRFYGDNWPVSTNIEDRRGEQTPLTKATTELVDEMKRLNDYLDLGEAAPGGLSGGALGLLSGGGGGTGGLGAMRMGGLGAGLGVGPMGNAAPYGSDVGAGTGAGGGGDLSRSAYDKMFAGTTLGGQYDNVVAAAQANNVPASTMAAIMAQETGGGKSNMLRQRLNPAGLMDPATHMTTGKTFGSIEEGIAAAGKTIGRNYAKGGGSIAGMAGIYAPVGAANDPGGLNRGWTGGVEHYQHLLSAGVASGAAGPAGDPTVPSDILSRARQVALAGGPGAVSQFMQQQGYPKAGNWCGEFAASVVKSVGGTPPRNPEVASNWRNFGAAVATPQPGDIAIRRGAATGALGSHVTFVESYDARAGTFKGLGGNQRAGFESTFGAGGYEFRRPGTMMTQQVEGTGTIDVNVNAPRGTFVKAAGGGMFKKVAINRQTQMEPAVSSFQE